MAPGFQKGTPGRTAMFASDRENVSRPATGPVPRRDAPQAGMGRRSCLAPNGLWFCARDPRTATVKS
jgi:hypothetical protein